MIEELCSRVMATTIILHRQHWKTTDLGEHQATNLYAKLHDALDGIIECYQGAFGRIGTFKVNVGEMIPDISRHLKAEADWIEQNKDEIANESCPVENLLDALIGEYRATVFMLTLK